MHTQPYTQITEQYQPLLERYARRQMLHTQMAGSVVREVFESLHTKGKLQRALAGSKLKTCDRVSNNRHIEKLSMGNILKHLFMKKYKFLLLVSCVLLAVGGVFAFVTAPVTLPSTPTSYHYKLNTYSLSAMQNINNWEVANPACGAEGDIPCVINFDGNSSQFDAYLDGFGSIEGITAVAVERKDSQ